MHLVEEMPLAIAGDPSMEEMEAELAQLMEAIAGLC